MAVVVYGYRPKIWFLLNQHERSDTLLPEIQSTPFDESPGNNIGPFRSQSLPPILAPLFSLRPPPGPQAAFLSPPTGEAVRFTTQYLLSPSAGRRPRVPGAVVIVADSKSVDNLTRAASSLKASGRSAALTQNGGGGGTRSAASIALIHIDSVCGRCESARSGSGPSRHWGAASGGDRGKHSEHLLRAGRGPIGLRAHGPGRRPLPHRPDAGGEWQPG